jgi:hypothetical protein
MANLLLSSNKVLFAILLILIVVCIYVILSGFNSNSRENKTEFKDVGPFQQYWLDPYAYNPNFAKDIYIVPGQARLAHNINTIEYDNSYLPYEGAVPAVDVLRANNKILPPSYYTQVIKHNTSPISVPIINTV